MAAVTSEIRDAIYEATEQHGQPESVAAKVVAWLGALTSGNEAIEDREAVRRHLELILGDVEVDIDLAGE